MVTGYGTDHVLINGERYEQSLILLPDEVRHWPVTTFEAITEGHFQELAALPAELVLLGTGDRLRFPHPRLTAIVMGAGRGFEVMSTQAACRTYNILLAEDRRVACALLVGTPAAVAG